jgi:hypothetical protein
MLDEHVTRTIRIAEALEDNRDVLPMAGRWMGCGDIWPHLRLRSRDSYAHLPSA